MSIFQAIILGIVQGLTEFLPISSQAHLYLVPYFLKWDYQGLGYDIALHWGTLAAILLVFGKDYWRYLRALFKPLPQPLPSSGEGMDKKMAGFLILGSIPAALVGFFLKDLAETSLRNPMIMVFTLAGFGFLLWVADRRTPPHLSSPTGGEEVKEGGLGALTWKKVFAIGFAQALAIVPGVSRSGATITAGLFSKLNRQEAARFSFLLSGPIIFGAGLVTLQGFAVINTSLLAGFLSAAAASLLAIKFLLRYLTSHNLSVFVWYRYVLAAILLLVVLLR